MSNHRVLAGVGVLNGDDAEKGRPPFEADDNGVVGTEATEVVVVVGRVVDVVVEVGSVVDGVPVGGAVVAGAVAGGAVETCVVAVVVDVCLDLLGVGFVTPRPKTCVLDTVADLVVVAGSARAPSNVAGPVKSANAGTAEIGSWAQPAAASPIALTMARTRTTAPVETTCTWLGALSGRKDALSDGRIGEVCRVAGDISGRRRSFALTWGFVGARIGNTVSNVLLQGLSG